MCVPPPPSVMEKRRLMLNVASAAPGSYVPPPMHSGPSGPREKRPKVTNLDQLFLSTRAKPKLYYLPVDKEVARVRMEKYGKGGARDRH